MTMASLVDRCRGCAAPSPEPVFAMDPMPLAGAFCRDAATARSAPRHPLTWLLCARCSLIQVGEDIPGEELYRTYHYASSSVPPLVEHFEHYAAFLAGRYGAGSPLRLLEIGCNDGVLLRRLPPAWECIGVDPSDVARRAGSGYELACAPFTEALVEDRGWSGTMDLITGSNCLAHIADLAEVFRAAFRALRPGGRFWIEVHDLEALLRGAQWDTIYHEHRVEWSVDSLRCCLAIAGFEPEEVQRLPLHGGLLRCGFRKAEASSPSPVPFRHAGELERLQRAYADRRSTPAVRRLLRAEGPVAAYGASGRACVYLNQMPELPVAFVIDDAPLRRGCFLPGVATPVLGRERLTREPVPRSVLITAWNYAEAIRRQHPGHPGEWLTAFPVEP